MLSSMCDLAYEPLSQPQVQSKYYSSSKGNLPGGLTLNYRTMATCITFLFYKYNMIPQVSQLKQLYITYDFVCLIWIFHCTHKKCKPYKSVVSTDGVDTERTKNQKGAASNRNVKRIGMWKTLA